MKTLGMIGGMGPEATIDYYRLIVAAFVARSPDGSYPPMLISSINLPALLDCFQRNALAEATELLAKELDKLAAAGADFGVLSSCSSHIVFDQVSRRSPIPLLSIVEATGAAAEALALKKVGLIGARFTMQGRFFEDCLAQRGILVVTPEPDDQAYIHEKHLGELVKGVVLPETRAGLLAIVEKLREREGIDALILGGTELPLILRDAPDQRIPFLDTARIHVDRIIAEFFA
jgi:aspartate racemase